MNYRVLSMWQPWAMFTLPNGERRPLKEYETRHWNPVKRAGVLRLFPPFDVVIHATRRFEKAFLPEVKDLYAKAGYPPIEIGKLIGVAVVTEIIPTEDFKLRHCDNERTRNEMRLGNYEDGRFAWRLERVRPLPRPIVFKGRQEPLYFLEPFTQQEVARQLGEDA